MYGLTYYNTCGHFALCSYFSLPLQGLEYSMQLAKYPHVLYVKPYNKVYISINNEIQAVVLLLLFQHISASKSSLVVSRGLNWLLTRDAQVRAWGVMPIIPCFLVSPSRLCSLQRMRDGWGQVNLSFTFRSFWFDFVLSVYLPLHHSRYQNCPLPISAVVKLSISWLFISNMCLVSCK